MTSATLSAPTKTLDISGRTFAYRIFGPASAKPIVFLNHLAANLDNWDYAALDMIAERRRVVIFDNIGVGRSPGETPTTIEKMADDAADFIDGLNVGSVDVVGLSMGGMVAQDLVMRHPKKVDKLVLVGTGPRGGKGIEKVTVTTAKLMLRAALTGADPKEFIFFNRNNVGKSSAAHYLQRLAERVSDQDKPVSITAFLNQLKAIKRFGKSAPSNLEMIGQPTLVINGDNDVMVPSALSFEMATRIANSQLEIFGDAGHGSLFQDPSRFASKVLAFLEE